MKSWKKITGIVLLGAISTAAYLGYKKYNDGPPDIKSATAVNINALNLLADYSNNENDANKKYIGKILSVSGEIKEINKNQEGQTVVILKTSDPMNSINCTMEGVAKNFTVGKTITLKGLCTGYMMDVYLTRCYIAE